LGKQVECESERVWSGRRVRCRVKGSSGVGSRAYGGCGRVVRISGGLRTVGRVK
jgi:hypothetical protein